VEDGSLQKYFIDTVVPQLPPEVGKAVKHAAETQEPMTMPNRTLDSQAPRETGAILLGDSWNMRHPLTGGGMTVALRDAELLTLLLNGVNFEDWGAVSAANDKFRNLRVSHGAAINVLANALHRVFTVPVSDDGSRQRLRDACYDYLCLGGPWTAGPVGLLSGLTASPTVLTTHFFCVALFAMRKAVFPFPTPERLRQAYSLLCVACVIILPMLEAEQATILSSRSLLSLADFLFGWRGKSCA